MKKNSYLEMKQKHSKIINDFPFAWAFSDKQFKEGMEKLCLKETDTDKVVSIPGGGFIRKTDIKAMEKMFSDMDKEQWESINSDTTGRGFIFEMFSYELANHEYIISYDVKPTLEALGISEEDLKNNKNLLFGLKLASKYELYPELSSNNLAAKINYFLENYDTYEYLDNLEIGETKDEVISKIEKELQNPNSIKNVIAFLQNAKSEMDKNNISKTIVSELIDDLNNLSSEIEKDTNKKKPLESKNKSSKNRKKSGKDLDIGL